MIELLGTSAVNTALTAGINDFYSLLRNRPSLALRNVESGSPRAYTKIRGVLISEKELKQGPMGGYHFQFNPQTIDDIKQVVYATREYTGLDYQDYVWANGGSRVISFQLFLDDTPASKTEFFRPTEVNKSKLAGKVAEIDKHGYSSSPDGKVTFSPRGLDGYNEFGSNIANEIVSQGRSVASSLKSTFAPASGPKTVDFVLGDAYSTTRINERGILPEVEKITSYLHPEILAGEQTPKFAEGGIVTSTQFRPPATVVLCLGPLYLKGKVTNAPVHYTLFDKDLTPIRATIDIEFSVLEFEDISGQNTIWSSMGGKYKQTKL